MRPPLLDSFPTINGSRLDPADGPALDGLLEVYRRHGFDSGYHQALRDQLEGLVSHAERYLLQRERALLQRERAVAKAREEAIAGAKGAGTEANEVKEKLSVAHTERQLIYGFVALLESVLSRQSPFEQASHPQFIGGLGI